MLSKGGDENSIYHAFAAPINEQIKLTRTARATSSVIKSGQKDTEASITLTLLVFAITLKGINTLRR